MDTAGKDGAIAHIMSESKRNIPHFYITSEIEMDEALVLLDKLNTVASPKLTINDLVMKATAQALLANPNLNIRFENGQIRHYDRVDLGMAVAVEGGLLVPVISDIQKLSLHQISQESKRISQGARTGHLRQEDYGNATFTISNLGAFDVDTFAAIITPPQGGILAIGTAKPTPVVRDGALAIAPVMKVTLSADHRVTDGAEAARFLQELKRILTEPYGLVI
jgi:pyruvate dehydrogenase E2 component (dihydrolipoamide acetyltransferase)